MDDWTPADTAASAAQGWGLSIVWDVKKEQLEYEVVATHPDTTRYVVSEFVRLLASKSDKLASKAMGLIFQSKVGSLRTTKQKAKQ